MIKNKIIAESELFASDQINNLRAMLKYNNGAVRNLHKIQ